MKLALANILDKVRGASALNPPGHEAENMLGGAMARMAVESEPFTHGFIDDFLPQPLYDEALASWPAPSEFSMIELKCKSGSGRDYGSRRTRLIEDIADVRLQTDASSPIGRISNALRSPAFVTALFERFAEAVETNLAALDTRQTDNVGFRLYLCNDEGTDEALGAHIDALRKILTIVIYLDLSGDLCDDSAALWGTTLYHKSSKPLAPLEFRPNSDFVPAKRMRFRANRAFVMPNAPYALHGVSGGQNGVVRRTIMCGYWVFDGK